jgi:hypothetical protein
MGTESSEIAGLKELMNRRFDELEKRMSDRKEYDESNIKALHDKDTEQDIRLNDHAERIRALEQSLAVVVKPASKTTWDKIKDSFISWCVPFIMGALLYYTASGGFKK